MLQEATTLDQYHYCLPRQSLSGNCQWYGLRVSPGMKNIIETPLTTDKALATSITARWTSIKCRLGVKMLGLCRTACDRKPGGNDGDQHSIRSTCTWMKPTRIPFTNDVLLAIQIRSKMRLVVISYWPPDPKKILHMPRQYSCRDKCKIL